MKRRILKNIENHIEEEKEDCRWFWGMGNNAFCCE